MNEHAVDRVAPTLRPHRRAVAFQRWRELLFLHWSYPPDVVRDLLPDDVGLDLHEGRAWVTCVPLVVEDSRPPLLAPGSGLDFLEVDLRTYVVVDGKPGVWFFSLDADSRMAVRVARLLSGLPFLDARIDAARDPRVADWSVERLSMGRPKLRLRYELGDALPAIHGDTLEWFLLERYYRFTRRLGTLWRQQVHHAPYRPREAYVVLQEQALLGAAGLPRPDAAPLAHGQEGLDVEFFAPHRARAEARQARRQPAPV